MSDSDSSVIGSIKPASEREVVISSKQRELFSALESSIKELQQRLNVVFATVCAGHDGLDNARFVRFGDGAHGVTTIVVSLPEQESK